MLAATLDPEGRRVAMTEERWLHIKETHPYLASNLREIMATVREPHTHLAGRFPGEIWFFSERVGRLRWLQVAVHYEGDEGWIATAFARKSLPPR